MNNLMDGVNPMALDKIEPAGKVAIKEKDELSDSEIDAYAKKTGKSTLKIKGMAQRAILGELSERLGCSRIGTAILLESEDEIQAGIKVCDEMIQLYAQVPEVLPVLMKVRLGFVDLLVKVAHTHIKSKKDAGPDMSSQLPQNIPFPPSVPVQVNIQTNVSQDKPPETKVD